MYDESIRYYVRALAMNPKADNAWQYLRISLRYDLPIYFYLKVLFTLLLSIDQQSDCATNGFKYKG